ncbi:SUMF1/EgtB/PvdO family nonheme iron enzyme, partial [Fibrobacterota bacterium]
MKHVFFIITFAVSALFSNENVSIEQISPGQRILSISLHDSIETLDLSQVSVDGYEIENVVLVEENDAELPTVLRERAIDITSLPEFRVIEFSPERGLLIIESPSEYTWEVGKIICDTAYQGLSRKIIEVENYENRIGTTLWRLRTAPASLLELVAQCDISFTSRPSLSFSLPDTQWTETNLDRTGDSSHSGLRDLNVRISLRDLKLRSVPTIQGRLRISQGIVEINTFQIKGPYELSAILEAQVDRPGTLTITRKVPFHVSHCVPLGSGLFIRISHNADLDIELESQGEFFRTAMEINTSEELHSDLVFQNGRWTSMASSLTINPAVHDPEESLYDYSSAGRAMFSLVPRMELLWAGETGLDVQMVSFSRVFQNRNYLASINRTVEIGAEARAKSVFLVDSGMRQYPDYLPLGTSERVVLTPPIQPVPVRVLTAGTDSIVLDWPHVPGTGSYIIQVLAGDSLQFLDSLGTPPGVIPDLVPNTEYTFRMIPINRAGIGIPTMITCATTRLTFPPSVPSRRFPENGFTVIDSIARFSWSSHDPDSAENLVYTLYLDTIYPPVSLVFRNHTDTSYIFRSLISDKHYYWKVDVSDGKYIVESPVWSFRTPALREMRDVEKQTPVPPYENTVYIPGGDFTRSDGWKVTISPFFMHKYEVTQEDFYEITGENPSYWRGDSLPVERVNWNDAVSYCRELEGRLPTEAEWEFAARGRTQTDYYWGKDKVNDYAWYHENSDNRTHPIGQKKANSFGLYDMSGNVFEWVGDWHGMYMRHQLTNPRGAADGRAKVTRGGSWYSDAASLKTSARFRNRPAFSSFKLGFRCAFPVNENTSSSA